MDIFAIVTGTFNLKQFRGLVLFSFKPLVSILIVFGFCRCSFETEPLGILDDPFVKDYQSSLIANIPHVEQKPDFCGEACAEMVLLKLGENMDQDYVFDRGNIDPSLGRGLYAKELAQALTEIGFDVGDVWTPLRSNTDIYLQFKTMLADLNQGVPSIVGMMSSDSYDAIEHFRLVVGFDKALDQVIFHEPAIKNGAYQKMERQLFLKTWPLKGGEFGVLVRLAMKPEALEYGETAAGLTNADYAQYVMKLKKRLGADFTVKVEKPFIVVGNELPAVVTKRARTTVRWTIDQLKNMYFKKDPNRIITIWIFDDAHAYYHYTKTIFKEVPISKFGYYSPKADAIFLNIAWGNGTLSHEIVHPFMAANFPGCPAWFNEGMGSLYETSTEKNNILWGRTNWRLVGLRQSIQDNTLGSFKTLMTLTDDQFYEDYSGKNYAQSRYLFQYLQDKGKLKQFYHQFVQAYSSDPTGVETLRKILDEDDLAAFDKKWQTWVMALKFN